MTTTCTDCGEAKADADFYPSYLRLGRRRCRSCVTVYERRIYGRVQRVKPVRGGPDGTTCTKCGETKQEAQFYASALREGNACWCRACYRSYWRERQREDPKHWAKAKNGTRKKARAFTRSVKAASGCVTCGENHPAVLDFHHLDPQQKSESLAVMVAQARSWKRLEAEIAKCVVLCANCHRKLHWEESQQTAGERPSLVA